MQKHSHRFLNGFDFAICWVDMDAYRHVSQTRYFDAMSETRAQWLRHALSEEALKQCFYYVAETQCAYYKAFKYPGVMQVKQYITKVRRANFTLQYDFYTPGNKQIHARGQARMVCIDPISERPMRIPELLLTQITPLE